ncbi:unnamed protein product, partial [Discosporangium mesarthrocarpum]
GHLWNAEPGKPTCFFCPICADSRKHSLQRFRDLATQRGGTCLSTAYKGVAT